MLHHRQLLVRGPALLDPQQSEGWESLRKSCRGIVDIRLIVVPRTFLHGDLLDGELPLAEISFIGDHLHEDPFGARFDTEIMDPEGHTIRYFRKSLIGLPDPRSFERPLFERDDRPRREKF